MSATSSSSGRDRAWEVGFEGEEGGEGGGDGGRRQVEGTGRKVRSIGEDGGGVSGGMCDGDGGSRSRVIHILNFHVLHILLRLDRAHQPRF